MVTMFGGYKLSIVAANLFGDINHVKTKNGMKVTWMRFNWLKENKPKGGEISSNTYNLNSTTEKNQQLLIYNDMISKRIKSFKNEFNTISDCGNNKHFNALN